MTGGGAGPATSTANEVRPRSCRLRRGGDPFDLVESPDALCRGCHVQKDSRIENERHDPARDAWRELVNGAFIETVRASKLPLFNSGVQL